MPDDGRPDEMHPQLLVAPLNSPFYLTLAAILALLVRCQQARFYYSVQILLNTYLFTFARVLTKPTVARTEALNAWHTRTPTITPRFTAYSWREITRNRRQTHLTSTGILSPGNNGAHNREAVALVFFAARSVTFIIYSATRVAQAMACVVMAR